MSVHFAIELERAVDGRWIAAVLELAGALAYGGTRPEAIAYAQALARRGVSDRLGGDASGRDFIGISFAAA